MLSQSFAPSLTLTLSICSTRMDRWSSCQELRRSFPSISSSTLSSQLLHPRDLRVACACSIKTPPSRVFSYDSSVRLYTPHLPYYRYLWIVRSYQTFFCSQQSSISLCDVHKSGCDTKVHKQDRAANRQTQRGYGRKAFSRQALEQK